jgi:hypothetical protein
VKFNSVNNFSTCNLFLAFDVLRRVGELFVNKSNQRRRGKFCNGFSFSK